MEPEDLQLERWRIKSLRHQGNWKRCNDDESPTDVSPNEVPWIMRPLSACTTRSKDNVSLTYVFRPPLPLNA